MKDKYENPEHNFAKPEGELLDEQKTLNYPTNVVFYSTTLVETE